MRRTASGLGYLLIGLAAALLGFAMLASRANVSVLERPDQWALDWQTRWRGELAPGTELPLLLVRVDDAALEALGGRVPDRAEMARAVQALQAGGARAVALDILLLPGGGTPEGSAALAAAMKACGCAVIPFSLPDDGKADAAAVPAPVLAQALLRYDDEAALARSEDWYRPRRLVAPEAGLAEAAAALGHISVRPEADGSMRRDLPLLRLNGEVYPSMPLRLAAFARGADWKQAKARFGAEFSVGQALQSRLDELSRLGVNYYGPTGSFDSVGFDDLLAGRVAPAKLQGRVVVLGVSALAAGDHVPTPFDARLPGMERIATVTDNLLTGRSLVRPAWGGAAELAAVLLLPFAAVALLARRPLGMALAAILLGTLALLAGVQWAFESHYFVFALAPPLLACGLATLGGSALRAGIEQGQRRLAARRLAASEQRYALAAQGANDGLWDWDLTTGEVYYSPRWLALMGLSAAEAGHSIQAWTQPLEPAMRNAFEAELQAHLNGQSLQFHQVLHFHQGGQERWLLARGLAVREDGKPVRMAGSLTDISESQRLQQQISFDALHDRLTGLANRVLFREQLTQLLSGVPAPETGLLLLGLDGFRALNEAQGPVVGDAVLTELGARLKAAFGARHLVARIGPDQFALLLAGGDSAADLGRRVQTLLQSPFNVATPMLQLTAGLSWAQRRHGPATADELMAAAEGALARAKAGGPGQTHEFDPAEQLVEQSRRWLRDAIDAALASGTQFELHYQPFVRLADRALLGFEALIRWRHPERGLIMPGDFIPVAEASGQICAIGRWALLEAAAQLRRWQPLGFTGEVAVNLSGVQLERDIELLADARATLAALGDVPTHRLKLEVTESMAMANPQRSAEVLQELARMGFKLSIDDFGTGYSSLAYLHRFPFDTLKVDRSFVIRLAAGREAQEIVRTIVGLALALGKQTLAEGVEDEKQAALLEQLGVQVGQGWLFAKALPQAQATEAIKSAPWRR
ncbi:diguanylate cyclase (GGDEF)-like protein/PAS domain S-box-containing protein [Pelomonas saccharophila]|uniref:Diguanylate cyclase (GGDEF)-like protein/PAS domain S-box-containing protein n=1 Tax=Roseateles saccharophilus TaxID=304 RepID=A0ABU1YRK3_ROSSA|nr:EAL domain-containing protein [Roseateles saccharophilus]MDR7271486.1 diguanylate cyclase (GGDEF)-like protein/PAS domain S-box-containing protein [Roseateles saccharophilus]